MLILGTALELLQRLEILNNWRLNTRFNHRLLSIPLFYLCKKRDNIVFLAPLFSFGQRPIFSMCACMVPLTTVAG